jgi:hypothetical protein
MFTLDSLLDLFEKHHQRVTYGAVAAWLSIPQRSLMQDRPKNKHNSWIVSKATGLPTGYAKSSMHPHLLEHDHVIETEAELRKWRDSLRGT